MLNSQAENKELTQVLHTKILVNSEVAADENLKSKKRKKSPVEDLTGAGNSATTSSSNNLVPSSQSSGISVMSENSLEFLSEANHNSNSNSSFSNGSDVSKSPISQISTGNSNYAKAHENSTSNFSSTTPVSILTTLGAKKLIIQKGSYIGLRGLTNLGNTCFMSTIIQALCHTPSLRNFFLSEKHIGLCNHVTDNQKQKLFAGANGDSRELSQSTSPIDHKSVVSDKCVVCEMSKILNNFYNGKTTPFCLDRLLHLVWTQARHLAGYEQQDAHEFLIALLDLMHQQLAPRSSTPTNRALWDPPMTMIDKIFTGRLQSDVKCNKCGCVSTTVDPVSDISLDLSKYLSKKQVKFDNERYTLIECLNEFTKQEQLGPHCKIECKNCKQKQESSKQLLDSFWGNFGEFSRFFLPHNLTRNSQKFLFYRLIESPLWFACILKDLNNLILAMGEKFQT